MLIIDNATVTEILTMKDCIRVQEEAFRKLPEGARVIFNLYVVEGYNHREIAEMINISEGTSKSQFARARQLLQGMIAKINAKTTKVAAAQG